MVPRWNVNIMPCISFPPSIFVLTRTTGLQKIPLANEPILEFFLFGFNIYILNFSFHSILKGEHGEQGAMGKKGDKGEIGEPGSPGRQARSDF